MKKVKEESISVVLASTIFDKRSAIKKNATSIVKETYHENYYG